MRQVEGICVFPAAAKIKTKIIKEQIENLINRKQTYFGSKSYFDDNINTWWIIVEHSIEVYLEHRGTICKEFKVEKSAHSHTDLWTLAK